MQKGGGAAGSEQAAAGSRQSMALVGPARPFLRAACTLAPEDDVVQGCQEALPLFMTKHPDYSQHLGLFSGEVLMPPTLCHQTPP